VDFGFNSQENAFRQEVDDFIKRELPANWAEESPYWPGGYGTIPDFEGLSPAGERFRSRLAEKGWLTLSWPKEYGGAGRSNIEQAIFQERLSYYRAPGPGVATLISGPTILLFGSDEAKREWLPKIARADIRFWLAYSEPNAGSDLASIQTRAVEDGDDLVINGQKTWSSGAHVSDYAWMLVRTDPNPPAHKGISLVIVDNKSEGIAIRPLINICGFHSFNEVFFDNVRIPKANIIGERNRGWYYAMAALDFERLVVPVGGFRRTFEELVQWVREMKHDGEALSDEPLIRDKLADIAIDIDVAYMLFWQTAWMLDRGLIPNIEASVLKLVTTELSHKLANTAVDVMGPYGELERGAKWAPLKGRICTGYLDCISALVGAGTSEIQRSIVAIRGLGLPWAAS
jgi:alkylation response protein AidB-like acyl-CoA dehydrogenase